MLHNLTIRNYLYIKQAFIDFSPGLTILTGETGAGKSILIDAFGFLQGGRLPSQQASPEGTEISASLCCTPFVKSIFKTFDLPLPEAEQSIILCRSFHKKTSVTTLNGKKISLETFKKIASLLFAIHGQFDQFSKTSYYKVLDDFAQCEHLAFSVASLYAQWKEEEKKLKDLEKRIEKLSLEKEWATFALGELKTLNPLPNEESDLLIKRLHLMDSTKAKKAILSVQEAFSPLQDHLQNLERILHKTDPDKMPCLQQLKGQSEKILDHIEEFSHILAKEEAQINQPSEEQLNQIEERLFALRSLGRKHHVQPDLLFEHAENFARKLSQLDSADSELKDIKHTIEKIKIAYHTDAQKLSKARKQKTTLFEKEFLTILRSLKLPHTHFRICFETLAQKDWTAYGIENIDFLISFNPGIPPASLKKIASGGELSRVSLALKVLLKEKNETPTLIFDEVDTGLGGAVADRMGLYLKKISQNTQVLAITHSPQLSAYGDAHLCIEKTASSTQTISSIHYLETEEEKVAEIARMLSGATVTPQTLSMASELRKHAHHAE